MQEEFKERLNKVAEGELTVVMSDGVRLIGMASRQDGHTKLRHAGVVIVQRGAMPGVVQGVVQQVKLVSIGSIDFCPGPMPELRIAPDLISWWYSPDMLGDHEDTMVKAYLDFIEGRASVVVEHKNADRMA